MPTSAANGFGQQAVNTGTWTKVFDADGYFKGAVRSVRAKSLSTSAQTIAVFPQYDDALPPEESDAGFPLEAGQSEEFSGANNIKGRIVALYMKSADATGAWGVTIP